MTAKSPRGENLGPVLTSVSRHGGSAVIKPGHRHEFEQLTVFGVRRLIQANMYDDEKLKRAVKWLQEREKIA
jgi:hypothetical protein